ncbi:MAG: cobalamin-binding protein [Gammaproteobacteria bacterium]|nr:cobalamin-binding protein [Gammaproteobacteria bacterium]
MSGTGTSSGLHEAVLEFDADEAVRIAAQCLAEGAAPVDLIEDCRAAMQVVGDRYAEGEYFLAELMLAGEVLKRVSDLLRPHLQAAGSGRSHGTMVLATLRGDIHYIGKDIFATLLEAAGFTVHNLGVDVAPERVVAAVREVNPDFVGFSGLLSTTFEVMRETAALLHDAGLRTDLKILIGGGVTTPEVREYVGADFQTRDAMAGVAFCRQHARAAADGR